MSALLRTLSFAIPWGCGVTAAGFAAGHRQWSVALALAILLVAAVVVWVGQLITERLDEQAAAREGARFTGERY